MLAFGNLMDKFDGDGLGRDELGLGRWNFMRFAGSAGVVTYMVWGYNPTANNKLESGTTYQQHRRLYIDKQKDLTCPRKRFVNDLIKQLEIWWEELAPIVLCADANENIYDKALGKRLTSTLGLNMKELVGSFTGQQVGATFFRGSKPIDGIWATSDLVVKNACIMPVGYGLGDHRLFIVDFTAASFIGEHPPTIGRLAARKLNTRIECCADDYNVDLGKNIRRHRLMEKCLQYISQGYLQK